MYRLTIKKQNDSTTIYTRKDVFYPARFELCFPLASLREGKQALHAHGIHYVVYLDAVYNALPAFLLSVPSSHRYVTVVLQEHDEIFQARKRWQPDIDEHIWYAIRSDPNIVLYSTETGSEYSKVEIPLKTLSYDEIRRTCNVTYYLDDPASTIFDALLANAAHDMSEVNE